MVGQVVAKSRHYCKINELELDQDVPESAWSDSDMIAQCNAWFVQWARILLWSVRVPGLVLEYQTTNVSLPDFANCLKETTTSPRAHSLAKRPDETNPTATLRRSLHRSQHHTVKTRQTQVWPDIDFKMQVHTAANKFHKNRLDKTTTSVTKYQFVHTSQHRV